jgi:hypothetical protein
MRGRAGVCACFPRVSVCECVRACKRACARTAFHGRISTEGSTQAMTRADARAARNATRHVAAEIGIANVVVFGEGLATQHARRCAGAARTQYARSIGLRMLHVTNYAFACTCTCMHARVSRSAGFAACVCEGTRAERLGHERLGHEPPQPIPQAGHALSARVGLRRAAPNRNVAQRGATGALRCIVSAAFRCGGGYARSARSLLRRRNIGRGSRVYLRCNAVCTAFGECCANAEASRAYALGLLPLLDGARKRVV